MSPMTPLPVRRLDPDLPLPAYARAGDAGLDLLARTDVELAPGGGRAVVPTGLAVAVPEGHVALVVPRSGLAVNHGITCLNTPGVVDSGYRGELCVILVNTDPASEYRVRRGDRIAQLLVQTIVHADLVEVDELPSPPASTRAPSRGEGGFGHTGR
jgi:dUTP pyrophosphatase